MTVAVKPPLQELAERFHQAVARAFGPEHAAIDPLVRRSDRADFQANLAMSLGKSLKRPPRDVMSGWASARPPILTPSSSTTAARTSPKRCTSGTCARA
jgi:arginyl-tRNA synthetase